MVRGPFHYENSLCNFWYKISDRCRGYWSTGPKTINLVRQTWGQCHYMRLTVGRSLNCDIFWHNVHKMTRPGTGHPYITYNFHYFSLAMMVSTCWKFHRKFRFKKIAKSKQEKYFRGISVLAYVKSKENSLW